MAEAYLKYLYSPGGRNCGENFYRPLAMRRSQKKYDSVFPKLKLFTIDDVFGGWTKPRKTTSPMAVPSTRLANANF